VYFAIKNVLVLFTFISLTQFAVLLIVVLLLEVAAAITGFVLKDKVQSHTNTQTYTHTHTRKHASTRMCVHACMCMHKRPHAHHTHTFVLAIEL